MSSTKELLKHSVRGMAQLLVEFIERALHVESIRGADLVDAIVFLSEDLRTPIIRPRPAR